MANPNRRQPLRIGRGTSLILLNPPMKPAIPTQSRRTTAALAALLLAILVGGALVAWRTVIQTDRDLRDNLLRQSQGLAHALNPASLQSLTGTDADLRNPEYLRLKAQLAAVRTLYPQCRFLYLIGRHPDGSLFFFLDVGQENEAPPGKIYDEASKELRDSFDTKLPFVEGPLPDEWGVWISAMVPLSSTPAGPIHSVLGMDIDAHDWNRMLARAALPPALLTLALGVLLLVGATLLARRARSSGLPPRWLHLLEPALAIAVGTVITAFAATSGHQRETDSRQVAFEQLATDHTDAIADTLHILVRTELESLARFYECDEAITPEAFQHFAAYLTNNPAIQAWEWVPAVPAADRARFEAQARTTGPPDFAIWQLDAQGKPVPATARAIFYPVSQVAPATGNEPALGFDLGSDPPRREALEAAARTGLTCGTDPLTLVQETEDQKSLLICRPVFAAAQPPRLRGFVVAALRLGTLLLKAAPDNPALLELSLLRTDAPPETLATDWDTTHPPATALSATRPILAFGKTFAVTARAGPAFLSLHPTRAAWRIALTGLALTAALTIVISVLLRRREQLERLVAARTSSLRESEARVRAITDSAQDAILMMDHEGRVSYWNPAAERILGYAASEAIGMNLHTFIVPSRYHAAHLAAFPAFQQTGQGDVVGKTLDLVARRKDGQEISVQLSLSALQRQDHWHAVGILRDITAQKHAEAELQETNRKLEAATARATEMATQANLANLAKSEFLANMSHEIRTPMNGVIGMTHLLLDTELNTEQRHCAEIVRASAESLLGLINDILDFSKIEAGKLDLEILDFNLAALLANFSEVLALQAQNKGLAFTCTIAPDVPSGLSGDPGRLRQVLLNLAGNAVKFTPRGEVSVRVSLVSATAAASVVRFAVRETGIGIPADKQALLFEKFTQVDASTARHFGGTGLGLAISKQLVHLMDGEIGVTSIPGQGSEFWFTACFAACLHPPAVTPPPPSPPPVSSQQWRGLRVLLAEDNLINQKVALGLLRKLELQVDVVATGVAAIEALTSTPYDLVLMDVQMPELSGLEATRLIRAPHSTARNPQIPIIAMTANAMQGDQQRCLDAGMNDYIAKPVTPDSLATVLEIWLPRAPAN